MADTAFSRPTLQQLIDRAEADLNSRLDGADARLRRSVLSVLARILSGQTHGLYGYLKWISRQAIVDTADAEHLERWGSVWDVARKGASKAFGSAVFGGEDGVTIAEGSRVQRSDGRVYLVTADAVVAGGEASVALRAEEAGVEGNAGPSVRVSFVTPPAGVETDGAVDGRGLYGGADIEEDAAYRERVLDRIQEPPHGGAENDYERWALEVPGVTRAWVYPQERGRGTVTVRFLTDGAENGIPTEGDVEAVSAYLNDPDRRPVTAEVFAVAPVPEPVNVAVSGLSPDTPGTKEAVATELADLFLRVARPGGTVHLSKIWEAVSIAAGEDNHHIAAPTADHVSPVGSLPVLGDVTFDT